MFVATLLILSVTWHLTDATDCTAVTGKTCKKSKYLTGSCINEKCACVTGYESAKTGCTEKIKPIADFVATDGGTPEQTGRGSGDVFKGGRVNMRCLPVPTTKATYLWTLNTSDILEQLTNILPLSGIHDDVKSGHNGQYRCRVKMATVDYVSDASDPITLKVLPVDGSAVIKPVVTSLYKRALLNATFPFTCTNIPSGISLLYEWYVAGLKVESSSQTYNLVMTDRAVSQNVTCKVVRVDRLGNGNFTSVESAPVFTPSSLTDDITGAYILEAGAGQTVYVEVGLDVVLHCRIVDTDLAVAPAPIVYGWTRDEAVVGPQSDTFNEKATTAHSGVYKCSAKVGTRSAMESAAIAVSVGEVMGKVTAISDPPNPTPLVGAYLSIECVVEAKNLSKVTYKWMKDDVVIEGQTDNVIQMNGLRVDDAGRYQCEATSDLVRTKSAALIVPAPVAITAVTLQTPTSDKLPGDAYGLGNKYTLTCGNAYDTPGLAYQWMRGGQVQSGATSKTYPITATANATLYSCLVVFNGNLSSKPSPNITVDAKNIVRVTILLANVTVSAQTVKPLIEAEVTLECNVTRASGSVGTATYSWLKNDQSIQSQTSPSYKFNASAATDGQYKCRAVVGSESFTSEAVNVASVGALEAPSLALAYFDANVADQRVYVEGASYIMFCITSSHTSGVQYSWLKDQAAIGGAAGRFYTITDARKGAGGDTGVYSCKATLGKSSVPSSNSITVSITEAGRPCNYFSDCLGAQFTTNCLNNRCECVEGLKLIGNNCTTTSGVTHLTGSVLLLVLALVM